jgi:hypothetical protein
MYDPNVAVAAMLLLLVAALLATALLVSWIWACEFCVRVLDALPEQGWFFVEDIAVRLRVPVSDVASAVLSLYYSHQLECKLRHHEQAYLTPWRTIEYHMGPETCDGDAGARSAGDGFGEEPNYRNQHRFKFRLVDDDDDYPKRRRATLAEVIAALRERFRIRTALAY